ncbi:hypothetical protein ACA910_012630 [Epithemia clementina (nom. ined.)]
MALSRNESVFVSSAGDVLVCRCRHSTYDAQRHFNESRESEQPLSQTLTECQKELAVVCCEVDDLSLNAQDNNVGFCGNWAAGSKRPSPTGSYPFSEIARRRPAPPERDGLLGGSPAQIASPLHPHYAVQPVGVRNRAQMAFQSDPISNMTAGFDDESIVPIMSFDYSQFSVSDDMHQSKFGSSRGWEHVREEKKSDDDIPEANQVTPQPPYLIHGVPTFLAELAQVKVTQVSAHPLGAHVLLISDAGLLWAYGLNDYGQLGLGKKTSPSGPRRGFITKPTIVIPLIENGGKAITCAAGVSHSIVAVMTEERRLVRSHTTPMHLSKTHHFPYQTTESIVHHQLYGFGRNDFMKIGLVSPKMGKNVKGHDEMEAVTLPRRVALRCRVPHLSHHVQHEPNSPPPGIFAIAASEDHSAALVHRSSGSVELYTWGNAMHGALGLPQQPISGLDGLHGQASMTSAVRVVPVPSFVASLSRSSNPDAQAVSMLQSHTGEFPISISLGRRCTFVTTSMGRAFSFGLSDEGMLGLGEGITESFQPTEISFLPDSEMFASVSAGATHTVALSTSGSVYTWGTMPQSYASRERARTPPRENSPAGGGGGSPGGGSRTMDSSTAGVASLTSWKPTKLHIPAQPQSRLTTRSAKVVSACAGFDSSAFLVESGHVMACGKPSGRLGLGETVMDEDVVVPRPLFGGLRLWNQKEGSATARTQQHKQHQRSRITDSQCNVVVDNRKPPPGVPRPVPLVRGSTFG